LLSAQALTPQNGVLTYDLSSQNSWTPSNSGFGQSELLPELWGLYAADGDQLSDQTSYDVNGADRILWSMDNGIFMEYRAADLDLNGEITGADRILWSRNTGINSGVLK